MTKCPARNVVDIPVSKVRAWCSRAEKNPVGAEYIIMEEVPGIELEQVWPNISIQNRFADVKPIAALQKAWMSVSFTEYGNLYYSKDLQIRLRDRCCTSTQLAIISPTNVPLSIR